MVRPRRIECPQELAEGRCDGIPYSRDLFEGTTDASIHLWMGHAVNEADLLAKVVDRALRSEAFKIITYSDGAPTGFWASDEL